MTLTSKKLNQNILALTMRLLQKQDITARGLVEETGLHLITAQRWLRALYKIRAVHISGWLPDTMGRDKTPIYRMGEAPDAPRRRTPRTEIARRYRQRQKEKANGAA